MGLAPKEFWWCRGTGVTVWCMVWGWLLRSSGVAQGGYYCMAHDTRLAPNETLLYFRPPLTCRVLMHTCLKTSAYPTFRNARPAKSSLKLINPFSSVSSVVK